MSGHVLILVACGAAKLSHPAAAENLYTSGHFALMLAAARSEAADTVRVCGGTASVAILSALHGLIDPATVLEPYDLKMGQPGSITAAQVAAQLVHTPPDEIVAMLPTAYLLVLAEAVDTLNDATLTDITVHNAFEAAPGIGYQRGVAASLLRTAGRIGNEY
ncbi:DUF6884 domain-containing protein [Mycolicibacterium palauense]|uniref:DUF6884 domain-containing protein n=1 Tax=Mycolicibacterium palauense TaxID=2034511 RepID=UPI00114559DE|nr:DUF6884 domain-containing protein [Mycolicibacterium palauense]